MDCGRPRQVSELWAALVRTTGLSNLPPWRACERTGQHLGRGEVTRGTRAGASRASTTVLARRFRADPHEVGRIEGLGLDSLELAEHVDQGQRRPPDRSAGILRRQPAMSACSWSQGAPPRNRAVSSLTRARRHIEVSSPDSSTRASVGRATARGYIPAYGVVDDSPPRGLAITRPRRSPLTPLGRGR